MSAGFFFMEEQVGGLHPCIDYVITLNFNKELAKMPAHQVSMACPTGHSFVPLVLQSKLITWPHNSSNWSQRTYALLKSNYWWPNMLTDIL